MTDVKRAYSSDLRADQARRTRWQIVAAAGELFEELGYAGTTIDAIAERAGVSRKTVFTSVGNKVELLHKAYDFAASGDDEPRNLIERPALQAVIAQENPWVQLGMYVDVVVDMLGRATKLWLVLRAAAEVDDAAHELYTRWERERREAMLHGPVPGFVARGVLRKGLDAEQAADLLWTFNDPALYDRLVLRAGWTVEHYAAWLRETMLAQVLEPEPSI